MRPPFLFLAAVAALLAVAMGAFGAHGLKAAVSPQRLAVYQTAVDYQMWHALALLAVAMLRKQLPAAGWRLAGAGWLLLAGMVLFSGSLYALVLLDMPRLGLITPVGGGCFLAAWLLLAIEARHH